MASIEQFVRAREDKWLELERALVAVDRHSKIDRQQLLELVHLYRSVSRDLVEVRALTSNPDLLARLNNLTMRAYNWIYRGKRSKISWRGVLSFFTYDYPDTVRREFRLLFIAILAFLAGTITGFWMVMENPRGIREILPPGFYAESAQRRVADIEQGPERLERIEQAGRFAAHLYTHNIQVSFLVFAAGALTLVGGLSFLFYNGIILGAISAQYIGEGVHTFLVAWIGPHGVLEIPAILIAGTAGLKMGAALWLPGDITRRQSIRNAFPLVWNLLLGASVTLVLAGLIEGSFSQFSQRLAPYSIKIGFSTALFLLFLTYLFAPGMIRRGSRHASG